MARYRAKHMGVLPGGRRVREGEEFEFEGRPGLWMTPVADDAPAPNQPVDLAPLYPPQRLAQIADGSSPAPSLESRARRRKGDE